MTAEELIREGDLDAALQELTARVRSDPADSKLRVFLFQLLATLGDWQRAATQLSVVGELDAGALAMKATYADALICEALRGEIFGGQRSPKILGEPEPWIARLIEAQSGFAQGEYAGFAQSVETALEEAPAIAGTVNGEPFEWIADADSRLGPILEVVLQGGYYWVPFSRIQRIVIEPPSDLRDVVWTPASFVWQNEGEAVGLIPTRYVGSEKSDDNNIRLARKTHWDERAENVFQGLGQRVLMTDSNEYALLDCREIILDSTE